MGSRQWGQLGLEDTLIHLNKHSSCTIFPQQDVTGKSFPSFQQIMHPSSSFVSNGPNGMGTNDLIDILNAMKHSKNSLFLYSLFRWVTAPSHHTCSLPKKTQKKGGMGGDTPSFLNKKNTSLPLARRMSHDIFLDHDWSTLPLKPIAQHHFASVFPTWPLIATSFQVRSEI